MCGISGIWSPAATDPTEAARLTFFALYALQHRGQESAGMAATDGRDLRVVRRMGLVGQVFAEPDLGALTGRAAIGHTRYSTTGSSRIENAQPMVVRDEALGELAIGHNGNVIDAREHRQQLEADGVRFDTSSDTEVMAKAIASAPGRSWDERIEHGLGSLTGAWSLVMLTPTALYAVRDPFGVRPLCLGRKGDAWLVASETSALDTIGATYVREVEPGELLRIDDRGPVTVARTSADRHALCVFEHVYLASASSELAGRSVYATRERMGEILATEHAAAADVVIPVPDSAIPAAVGYARATGIPFREGLIKNRYIGRTFIQPSQELRRHNVALKYNALRGVLSGKRVVVVDDSIVRGSTSGPIVDLLRRNGAREVHMRICSPPIRWSCHFGVDMARKDELIAAHLQVEDIRRHIGADSLGYLSLEGMIGATGATTEQLCSACFTGDYPMTVQLELDKGVLERA
ncbi:MAG: amidophosphoribosyltransferase [Chloroflexi bacterium RIFCSPLOWO2_12_FULL_71_12]|nr:MAG: amidophosphoribosyltransferase [Chloroflexi bacterium GWC2_70_10]OGO69742.1 MAG: amidophosphoribosyltransferase [Chloroflexi bacterium RIFCSPLOWO2_02_FULL_71_16]OGO74176.1 MAG: amidophosphoribosyltransferase [Chloroflexi bacterium RIFCSPLOWO2_12_FULL_71_12]